MKTDIAKLRSKVEQFCSNAGPLFLDENKELLVHLLKAFCYEEGFLERNQLMQMISMVRHSSETDIATYAHLLHSIAFDEYEHGNINFAEYLFRGACDLVDDTSLNNNLAYVLRRSKNNNSLNRCEIITLLFAGVQKKEPFCLINMGLLFSLTLSDSNDWRTADDLFSLLPDNLNGADSWWERLGQVYDDIEGYLVHFFLLRHKRIEQSSLGSIRNIVVRLKKNIDGFPDWLADDYAIKTLDDVIECINDPDFDSLLEEFLGKMACSRENVDEMIEAISGWDIWPIYNKLLTECDALLTAEETAKLKSDYKEKFSIPLPDETE